MQSPAPVARATARSAIPLCPRLLLTLEMPCAHTQPVKRRLAYTQAQAFFGGSTGGA